MMNKILKKLRRRFTPMSVEERRHAHRMILLSSAGMSLKCEEDGMVHVLSVEREADGDGDEA